MGTPMAEASFFGTEKISRILLKIAPPVMLAQLIQAMYNIVDSFFVGKYSADALTALTVIYPLQLIIIALAVGTGVGVNTYMARKYAQDRTSDADNAAGCGMVLAAASWLILMITALLVMHPYVMMSASSERTINDAVVYGNIVCIGSLGIFIEGNWTKVLQAEGNMRLPMAAQIIGASFLPVVISLMMPVFFQAIGDGKTSMFLSFARQIFCLVPLFWLFSLIGLSYAWIGFPAAETISGAICLLLYYRILRSWGIAPKK